MGKLPAFQFYPGDWMKDPSLRACSLQARGLWIDMLCLMHESVRRGYLQHPTNSPVTAAQIARMTGCATDETEGLLRELTDSGVCSCTENGVIYSRRMVRDEKKRAKCVRAGRLGGNPTLMGQDKGRPKGEPTPSVSSSSSSSDKDKPPKPPAAEPPAFSRFWTAWPKHSRKSDRRKCLARWLAHGLEAKGDLIVGAVARFKSLPDWTKDGGQFIPAPLVWLNREAWEALGTSTTHASTGNTDGRLAARRWLRGDGNRESVAMAQYRAQNPGCRLDDTQLRAWPVFEDFVAASLNGAAT